MQKRPYVRYFSQRRWGHQLYMKALIVMVPVVRETNAGHFLLLERWGLSISCDASGHEQLRYKGTVGSAYMVHGWLYARNIDYN